MEATLRPYDRGEEVTPFATLGLYHALPSYAYPFAMLAEGWMGRAMSSAYPARLNSQM